MYQNPPPAEIERGLWTRRLPSRENLARCLPRTWVREWHVGATRVQGEILWTPSPVVERGGETDSWQLRAKTNKVKELRKVELTQPAYADGVMEGWEG